MLIRKKIVIYLLPVPLPQQLVPSSIVGNTVGMMQLQLQAQQLVPFTLALVHHLQAPVSPNCQVQVRLPALRALLSTSLYLILASRHPPPNQTALLNMGGELPRHQVLGMMTE